MKFAQLPIGQSFRFQGRTYRKDTPLMACAEGEEKQRLIARSADVEPLESTTRAPTKEPAPTEIPVELINQAMQQFADEITQALSHSGLKDASLNQTLSQLQQAMLRARQAMGLH